MSDADLAVGIDIGGTKLVAATVGRDGRVHERRRTTTPAPRGQEAGASALVDAILAIVDDLGPALPVGIGVAALVDRTGRLHYAPNLSVRDLDLGSRLQEALGRGVSIRNDATVAGIAEHRVGSAQGHDHVVMVTIGTGVGGCLVVEGAPVLGAHGFGSELGHVVVDRGGPVCPCGNRGCLEAVASGSAMARAARDGLADRDVGSVLREVEGALTGRDVTTAADGGDRYAIEVIRRTGTWLGIGLAGFVNALDPSLLVVGGGAAVGAGTWLLPTARRSMAGHLMGNGHRPVPELVPAALGDDAGLVGAALVALEERR